MTEKPKKTGKELERRVAQAYRDMGARKVEQDVEMEGHQIDVYVELETADRGLQRIAVEAKDYTKPVGIRIVTDFSGVVDHLRRERRIDRGVIVSAAGFSRQARNAAEKQGIRLLEPADLDAMVAGQRPLLWTSGRVHRLRRKCSAMGLTQSRCAGSFSRATSSPR